MHRLSVLAMVVVMVLLGGPVVVAAQDATPVVDPAGGGTVVASGLTNPRGMTWGADGTLFVALAGTGGETPGDPPTPPPLGPFLGGPTAAVVSIAAGCPAPVAAGLPSTRDGFDMVTGVADLAILGEQLYALVAAGSAGFGNPGTTNGVFQVNADGTTFLVADYTAWLQANPPAQAPPEGFPNPGNLFAMVADPTAGLLWAVDALNGLVVTVAPDGTITLAADLSADHPVPTGIALAPEGGVYVANLTAVPYPTGAAKVVGIAPDGTVGEVWTGLTAVTGLAVGPDGTLYATEMSTDNPEEPPFLQLTAGRLVRQTGPDTLEEVATGLPLPVALKNGPDAALYVAMPAFGADDGSGTIVRFALDGAATPAAAAAQPCVPVATPVA